MANPSFRVRRSAQGKPFLKAMITPTAVHGHEIIDLVSSHPQGIRLSQLAETVTKLFGHSATFHTSSTAGMDLDGLLVMLEASDKVRISRGVVHSGGSPAHNH